MRGRPLRAFRFLRWLTLLLLALNGLRGFDLKSAAFRLLRSLRSFHSLHLRRWPAYRLSHVLLRCFLSPHLHRGLLCSAIVALLLLAYAGLMDLLSLLSPLPRGLLIRQPSGLVLLSSDFLLLPANRLFLHQSLLTNLVRLGTLRGRFLFPTLRWLLAL